MHIYKVYLTGNPPRRNDIFSANLRGSGRWSLHRLEHRPDNNWIGDDKSQKRIGIPRILRASGNRQRLMIP